MSGEDTHLRELLDQRVRLYNQPSFIDRDPISVPHRFSKKQDREISGFFAAVLVWGNRTTIINNCNRLMQWMDNAPYDFVVNHRDSDLKKFLGFVHRTFNATDLLYFLEVLQRHYTQFNTLEDAFVPENQYEFVNTEQALIRFYNYFFSGEYPRRTTKHIANPLRNSACKRINMFLRWMVRRDQSGVDFGLWNKIGMHQLVCPLDVHVARVAERLQLIPDKRSNWRNGVLLTQRLSEFRPEDPVIYDYALFSLGAEERF